MFRPNRYSVYPAALPLALFGPASTKAHAPPAPPLSVSIGSSRAPGAIASSSDQSPTLLVSAGGRRQKVNGDAVNRQWPLLGFFAVGAAPVFMRAFPFPLGLDGISFTTGVLAIKRMGEVCVHGFCCEYELSRLVFSVLCIVAIIWTTV